MEIVKLSIEKSLLYALIIHTSYHLCNRKAIELLNWKLIIKKNHYLLLDLVHSSIKIQQKNIIIIILLFITKNGFSL